jgi:hypothetical protein
LKSWWVTLLEEEPPIAETWALWFGLFEADRSTTF